jgi:type VI secretion system protein ImpA
MPLRDDLLDPIPGDNPSGRELRYDPVFDLISEARREEDETLPTGDWKRPIKKADHLQVAKLAGEALATRSKHLSLAASLVESIFKLEGLGVLAPSIELLCKLQEKFWDTLYPEIDDGDLQLRSNEIERAAKQMALILRDLPLTRSGLTPDKHRESRTVGYEEEATTDDRKDARKAAIAAKKLTAEEFDKAVSATPKSFYVDAKAALDSALEQTDLLDRFQRRAYGDQYPQLSTLIIALQEAESFFNHFLSERRKTEPDPIATFEKINQWQSEQVPDPILIDHGNSTAGESAASSLIASAALSEVVPQWTMPVPSALSCPDDAYLQIVCSAQFLFEQDVKSPVPYLVCSAIRLGETLRQGVLPERGFAIGPSPEVRRSLRAFALNGAWIELLRASLPVLAEPCARAWLDLHRYIWRAAKETGATAIMSAVSSTLRELLLLRPEVRHWTLEDDTGAANPETQIWIDGEVLNATSHT